VRFRTTGYRQIIEVHVLFPRLKAVGEAHRLATILEERLPSELGMPAEVDSLGVIGRPRGCPLQTTPDTETRGRTRSRWVFALRIFKHPLLQSMSASAMLATSSARSPRRRRTSRSALSRRLRGLRPSLADQSARTCSVRVPAAEKCASEWQSTAALHPSPEARDLRGTSSARNYEGSSTKLSESPDCAIAQTRS
jgi:hypothetical protein